MESTKYLEALIYAIQSIYKEERAYFSPMQGCEQAVQFRIAHKMANLIEDAEHDINVDCEARKCNGYIKENSKRPDIIVHKRRNKGCLVVEIKCSTQKWNNDFEKLELYTLKNKSLLLSNNIPTYELGAFVYLTDNWEDIQMRVYENGCDVTEEYPYNQILKGIKHA